MTTNNLIELDVRSVALFRVLLSCIIIYDIIIRFGELEIFYTSEGVLPLRSLFEITWQGGWDFISLQFISDSSLFASFFFIVYLFSATFLLIGYRTKLNCFLCWIFITSLHNRMPIILNNGDLLLRLTLLWANFLPLGHYWSLDNLLSNNSTKTYIWRDWAVVGWWFQLSAIYLFSYGLKIGKSWEDGSALQITLQHEQFLTPFGHYFRELFFPSQFYSSFSTSLPHPIFDTTLSLWILKVLTKIVLYFELIGPFLLMIPIGTKQMRDISVILFTLMHIGFGVILNIGIFWMVPIVGQFSFFSSMVWDRYLPLLYSCIRPKNIKNNNNNKSNSNMIYSINTISDKNKYENEEEGCVNLKLENTTIRRQIENEPIRYITVKNMIIVLLITYCLYWNLAIHYQAGTPSFVVSVSEILRIDQRWDMFAPDPPLFFGWFKIKGELLNGQQIDLMPGVNPRKAPTSDRPKIISHQFPNQRWRKFFMNLVLPSSDVDRLNYGQYLCRSWNFPTGIHMNNQRLKTFEIWYYKIDIKADITQPQENATPMLLWSHICL